MAEVVLASWLVPACSWGNYLNNLDAGTHLVATPLPFSSFFFSCLSWSFSFHSPKAFTCQLSNSLGGQKSRMDNQNSRKFSLKSILKWNLYIKVFSNEMGKNKFELKSEISNKHPVREALVQECHLTWLTPANSTDHFWSSRWRGLRIHSCTAVSQPLCERITAKRKDRICLHL